MPLLTLSLSLTAMLAAAAPAVSPGELSQTQSPLEDASQIARDEWKDCLYNKEVIRCRDEQTADGLRIIWVDGVRTQLDRRPPARPGLPSYWRDRYGGLWRRELLIQGNTTLLTNLGTGNRILIPLRFPCKPPLKGEVGYCRY